MKKYFGTDGIRGRVGIAPIMPEFILKLGWAVGRVLKRQKDKSINVIIGKDTRISGYLFESALEAGLSSAGVNIHLLGPMPTPGIAYLTRTFRADVGIVISASHNPFHDNGIKFFTTEGFKLSDELESQIEQELEKELVMVDSAELGKAARIDDAAGRYIEFCKSTFPTAISLQGLKIVLDCANGATYHVAPHVLQELGAEIIDINSNPDGFNINQQCGSTHPDVMRKIVLAEHADLGIALDGDGDRVLMVDHKGNIIDGDQLLYIIAMQAKKDGSFKGGVVGTEMSNLALEQELAKENIPFIRAKVGDRYVMEALKTRGWCFGGESSGHIVCLNMTSTGDGIVSALQVLAAMIKQQKTLYELASQWQKLPQILKNVRCHNPKVLMQAPKVQEELKKLNEKLGNKARALVRASGTEPLIRVMLEGENINELESLTDEFVAMLKQVHEANQ
ncbi:MAG: glmM [Gammaproteobacteria bacterium]|jgi:phosphoglucosamine mutase|nr:glmM [Gammaproteobacteria bacterium]